MGLFDDLAKKHSYQSFTGGTLSICIPTITRLDLLSESLIDISNYWSKDLTKLLIVDNGKQGIMGHIPESIKPITTVYEEQNNLGVAQSWNKMIYHSLHTFPTVDHILILNDDIVLGKSPETIFKLIEENPDYSIINANYFWAAFLLSRHCVETIGYFDENFYPAYFEDNDYSRRESLSIGKRVTNETLDPVVKRASQTILKDRHLNGNFGNNAQYYQQKWGGPPDHERFRFPFNKPVENSHILEGNKGFYHPFNQNPAVRDDFNA